MPTSSRTREDWFFDTKDKQLLKFDPGDLDRGFVQFVVNPIKKVFNAMPKEPRKGLSTSPITSPGSSFVPKSEKELMNVTMCKWLPAAGALLETVVLHLPFPVTSPKRTVSATCTKDMPMTATLRPSLHATH